MTKEEKQLLLHLLDHDSITRREAVSLLNLGKSKLDEVVAGLLDIQLIVRKGLGRNTSYVLKEKEVGDQ